MSDITWTACIAALLIGAYTVWTWPVIDYDSYGGEVTYDANWSGGGYVNGRGGAKISLAGCTTYSGRTDVEMGACTVPVQRTLADWLK